MFKRRKPLSLLETVKQFFWPDMGLRRTAAYMKHRLLRVGDSTHKISLGLAVGLGVSFTPLLGTHFIQAGIFSYILRGNIYAAMIGTFIGNPWTFPFFWWAGFSFGKFMYSVLHIEGAAEFPHGFGPAALWDIMMAEPSAIFLPWLLGGYVLAAISIVPSYFVYFYLIEGAKAARVRALAEKQDKTVS